MSWRVKKSNQYKPKFGSCNKPHVLCIENVFPKTNTVLMTVKDEKVFKSKYLPMGFVIQGKDALTNVQPENIGTQVIGSEDSGTGHWIMNYETDPPRAV